MKHRMIKRILTTCMASVMISGSIINESHISQMNYTVLASTQSTASIKKTVPVVKIVKRTSTTATMKIDQVKGATKYKIYRSSKKDGSYELVGTTNKLEYTDKKLSAKKAYYYKVKAVKKEESSKYSQPVKVAKTLDRVEQLVASRRNQGILLKWNSVQNATSYRVYRSTSKDGEFKYIGTSESTTYQDKTANLNQTFYYKVRAYKKANNIKYYGVYSSVVKVNKIYFDQNGNGSTGSGNGSTGSGNGNTGSAFTHDEYAKEVIRLVNVERAKKGLTALTTTTKLQEAAYLRAVETKTQFSHTRPDGTSCFTVLEQYGIGYRTCGENIAYGQRSPEEVVTGWMNSEGHRKNIMNGSFGKVGIGVYQSNGIYYWTQLFTD